ncbi:MAG: hypothetical protein KJO20_07600, partial [Eudoraea sp.]|nr:hypothetical protein [Eudoraea sp.]MBT8270202.1 hypothetical protein [Bacteroidia bacterium]
GPSQASLSKDLVNKKAGHRHGFSFLKTFEQESPIPIIIGRGNCHHLYILHFALMQNKGKDQEGY